LQIVTHDRITPVGLAPLAAASPTERETPKGVGYLRTHMTGEDVSDPATGDGPADPAAGEGRFLVTHADAGSAVLKDVESGQVHTLADNPGVEEHDVLEATVEPEPPMEVTWRVTEVRERRSLRIEASDEPPTARERDIAVEGDVGDLIRRERAGEGEIHVLTVPPGRSRRPSPTCSRTRGRSPGPHGSASPGSRSARRPRRTTAS
jgi:hypothetical protein